MAPDSSFFPPPTLSAKETFSSPETETFEMFYVVLAVSLLLRCFVLAVFSIAPLVQETYINCPIAM